MGVWDERPKITGLVGKGMYVIAAYEKVKRITIPLNNNQILFVSVSNTPLKNSKKKSYGHGRNGKNNVHSRFVNSSN